MDHAILNHGQVTWMTPELTPPLLTTTPHQRENVSAFDKFNVHRCPTRLVFSGTGLELVTRQATIRYLYHSATAADYICRNQTSFVCTLHKSVDWDCKVIFCEKGIVVLEDRIGYLMLDAVLVVFVGCGGAAFQT
ncbi:uncharacterized protein TNCV_1744321 [Trichonephila clavipes]|nr:uncharacterized protein TNCV_1744321 [Trichonephila clavipes]